MAIHKAKPLGVETSLNYEIVNGTAAPTVTKKENTIWVNTSTSIGYHCFNNSGLPTKAVTTSFDGTGGSARYYTTGSGTSSSSDWSTGYMTVKPNIEYTITKNESSKNISIAFFKSASTSDFISYTEKKTNTLTFTTPSNCKRIKVWSNAGGTQATFDKLDWKLIQYKMVRADGSDLKTGDVWIQTDIDNALVNFNAIKNNDLRIYPSKITQYDGTSLKPKEGWLINSYGTNLICNSITYLAGGYETINNLWNVADGGTGGNTYGFTSDSKGLYTVWGGSGSVWINAITQQSYNMTGINTVNWTLSGISRCTTYFQIRKEDGSYLYNSALGNGTYSYDISAYNGPVYFRLATYFSFPNNGTDQNGDGKVDWYTGYSTLSSLSFE